MVNSTLAIVWVNLILRRNLCMYAFGQMVIDVLH